MGTSTLQEALVADGGFARVINVDVSKVGRICVQGARRAASAAARAHAGFCVRARRDLAAVGAGNRLQRHARPLAGAQVVVQQMTQRHCSIPQLEYRVGDIR